MEHYMEEKKLKVMGAGGYARAAAIDAQKRNTNNKSLYSAQQIRDIESAASTLDYVAYFNEKIYVNYRKKFAAIKIDKPRVKSKKAVAMLEEEYLARGWEKVVTPQATIYRAYRN